MAKAWGHSRSGIEGLRPHLISAQAEGSVSSRGAARSADAAGCEPAVYGALSASVRPELSGGSIQSHVKDHAGEQQSEQAVPKRSVIGIGGGKHYTLYDPAPITSCFELRENLPTLRGRALADCHV